jgi:hypothetical protein
MKKCVCYFYFIVVIMILADFGNIANAAEKQMILTFQTRGKVSISLFGTGEATVDWGDGSVNVYNLHPDRVRRTK